MLDFVVAGAQLPLGTKGLPQVKKGTPLLQKYQVIRLRPATVRRVLPSSWNEWPNSPHATPIFQGIETMQCKLKYVANEAGVQKEKEIDANVELYAQASAAGLDLRQYLRTLASDFDVTMGDPIDQMMTNAGMMDGRDRTWPSADHGSDGRHDPG